MNKKFLVITSAALLVSTLIVGTVFAATKNLIKIIVNGQEIKSDISPQIANGTTMVPIKVIAQSLGADVKWDKKANSVIITTKEKKLKNVANILKEEVVLSAIEKDGIYEDFTLEVKGSKRFFDWKNVSNPTYAPELLLSDINHDGQKELIVILTTGTGTGVHVTEAHIINPETLVETYIDNPAAIILKNVKTKITKNEAEITIGDQKTVIDKESLNIEPENLFSDIDFNSSCSFEVINNELRVSIGSQISPASFIGDVQISYMLKDNMYQARKIEFKKKSD